MSEPKPPKPRNEKRLALEGGGMTRVIITGCRHWRPEDLARRIARSLRSKHGDDVVVVHGAAPGVDCTFDEACRIEGLRTEPHPADWEAYGNSAGPKRNAEMVSLGADFALAVHRNIRSSRGTRDCARKCLAAGIPVWLIDSEVATDTPKRLREV